MTENHIDPVCIFHGKRHSEHVCLYCCLCFKPLTPETCHLREEPNGATHGVKEDVCEECAQQEKAYGRWLLIQTLKAGAAKLQRDAEMAYAGLRAFTG